MRVGVNLRHFVYVCVWECEERDRENVFKVCTCVLMKVCVCVWLFVFICASASQTVGGWAGVKEGDRKMQLMVSSTGG